MPECRVLFRDGATRWRWLACVRTLALLSLAILPAAPAGAADTAKTVLILRAEGTGAGDPAVIERFEATLRGRWPSRIKVYVEDVSPGRFSAAAYRHDLPEYLREKHAGRVDLVVVLSRQALEFLASNRAALFPRVPVLYGGSGESVETLVRARMTGVIARPEPAQTIAIALRLHPDARQVVMVGGTGAGDRMAERQAQEVAAALTGKLPMQTLTELPFSELIERLRALPPGTVVLYTRLTRDGAGASFDSLDALRAMRQATEAPIYGSSRAHLGAGVVGGVLVDHAAIGEALGSIASRVLAGEATTDIRPIAARNVLAFDARELTRLGIDPASLPHGAAIEFAPVMPVRRVPSSHLLYFALIAVATLSAALALVLQHRRRTGMKLALKDRQLFERTFADVSSMFIRLPAPEIDAAMRGALERMLAAVGADHAVVYEAPESPDAPWPARFSAVRNGSAGRPIVDAWDAARSPWLLSRLRAAQVVTFLDRDTREQLAASVPGGLMPADALAAPLAVGASILGVLWCIWLRPIPPQIRRETFDERFRLAGDLFANALRRRQIEASLHETRDLNAAILESLVLNVAVLDRAGTIIAVNDAWMAFGRRHDVAKEAAIAPGANYLAAAQKGAAEGAPLAREAYEGIRAVCEGRRSQFHLEYECSWATGQRWFQMNAALLRRKEGGAVVTHRDITDSKRIEAAIRESEARFRLLADALPVGVWTSDADGGRTYFNRMWLEFTGRDRDQLVGDGWIEIVHPDDRKPCVEAYRSAFAAREPCAIEYRIRRCDGRYAWFMDTAVPRYGDDGTFHGFVGGCLDVTERKESERALRDLTGRVISAEEEDRRRIARDLHDGVSQLVALLAIEIEQLSLMPVQSEAELSAKAKNLWKRTSEIAGELHRLSHALHPSRLETFGLVTAVGGCCAEISRQQQVKVTFTHGDMPGTIPPEAALCVFRIVQEALRNVVKHSGAHEASVELAGVNGRLLLRVSDAGRGFEKTSVNGGLGLVSMRERVRFAGGELEIVSRPGGGTRIEVDLPLNAGERPSELAGSHQ